MAVSSDDAVDGYFPSPNSETLDGKSLVLPSSNPSSSSSLPSGAIFPSNLSGSDKTLGEEDLPAAPQISGQFGGFSSELDVKDFDPMSNNEESLMDEYDIQVLDQCLDDTPIETRDFDSVVSFDGTDSSQSPPFGSPIDDPMVNLPVDPRPRETPIWNDNEEDDFADLRSDMGFEPEENPSAMPLSCWYSHADVYRSCICNRYGRLRRPGRLCGPECEFRRRTSNWWDSSGGRWGYEYDQDDRPLSFSFPEETGVGAGLSNLGNTCFLNAILQCFTHTVPFVKALRSSNHLMPCQCGLEGFCVVCALRDHIERSIASSGKIISPSQVVDNLSQISSCFHRYQQEDAHEFLQCLLEKLERSFDSTLKEDNSSPEDNNIVQRVFGGRLVSKLQCCNCGHCSDKYEPLIDLSLEIEDAETLQNALESFTKVEKIEDVEAKFRCDSCKVEVSMEKQLMLDQAPSVAALHLKRFKTDGSFIEKIGKHVDFPLELDLEPYSNGSKDSSETQIHLKYHLYAVVVHNGYSPTSGHYFCYVRSSPSIWHKLDDSMVTRVEEVMVLSEAAYILFYVRDDAPWFSSLMETQKDPNTSPKSVLDTVESESAAYPRVENIDLCKASVNSGDVERSSIPIPCEPMIEDDQMNQTGIKTDEIAAQISCGSKNAEAKSCCDKSKDDVPMNDASVSNVVEATNSPGDKLGVLLPSKENNNNNNGQVVHRTVDPLVPPSSAPPKINIKEQPESRQKIRRNHLKLESLIMGKKMKCKDERVEACRYIHKNVHSSRGMKLLAAMVPRNDKKRRSQSSPCKQGSPPGSRSKLLRRQEILR